MHFFATLMVALGSIFSAIWIVIANSWMHTPAGYEVQVVTNPDGTEVTRAVITDFWGLVFNPSSVNRLVHVVLGAFIQGAFFVMSISAYYVLRNHHLDFAKRSFTVALVFGADGDLTRPLRLGELLLGSESAPLRSYPIITGLFAVSVFAMHGSIYLYLETEGDLQARIHRWTWVTYSIFLTAYLVLSACTLSS